MPCYHPLKGYRAVAGGITWNPAHAYVDQEMTVSCGQCIGCRLERSRQWAVRIMHEAQLHCGNCFVTLTYADEHLPEHGSLEKDAFPKFMKRLRKAMPDDRLRYFHVGEYGAESWRPHYHACVFGTAFADRVHHATRNGHSLYRSDLLDSCWSVDGEQLGHAVIGELTFESAAYVARYCTKKVTGSRAELHYQRVDPETGEVVQLTPEYATMSRRPGIGRDWIERYSSDVYPSDEVIGRGHPGKPPRYYDLFHESQDPEEHEQVKLRRMLARDKENSTDERLAVRKTCTEARLSLYSPRTGVE